MTETIIDNPFDVINRRFNRMEQLLLEIKKGADRSEIFSPKEPGDELLTTTQAAEFLGLSTATIYQKIHNKELPCSKPPGSKRVYFSKKALLEFITSGRVKTKSEIEKEAVHYLVHKKGKVK